MMFNNNTTRRDVYRAQKFNNILRKITSAERGRIGTECMTESVNTYARLI